MSFTDYEITFLLLFYFCINLFFIYKVQNKLINVFLVCMNFVVYLAFVSQIPLFVYVLLFLNQLVLIIELIKIFEKSKEVIK